MIASLLLLIPALLGARLLFILLHWRAFKANPKRIWRGTEGGAALYGGLILMVPMSLPLLMILRLPFGSYWDTASLIILVALALTRLGCLLNGCCGGRVSRSFIALTLTNYKGVRERRIPVQLFEAGAGLVLLGIVLLVWNEVPFGGAIFLFILAAYGAVRFVLEGFREEQDRIGNISLHRVISAVCFIGASVIFVIATGR
ncbi:prolipoprotein diacylglyceryltransferase [Rhizomicrobium palustre]|uniref:Prolipoprotein diacylglyceryltransferase n=2 Tax=Rhizomicrobium palustre TaxID=189966 RepID=A0A846MVY2_9PROT|nr:prolipoprotein diacylglyceryltransferase [Rhizomicrobium palustre]